MSKPEKLCGVVPASVTPFKKDESVDTKALLTLMNWNMSQGADSFFIACGVGRTQDWNSHNIEHELSALYDCAHGAGLAVTMPAVFTYVMNHNIMRFAQAAVRVWGCQMDFAHPENTAKAGIEALRSFLKSIGMPGSFAELGAKEEDIPKLVEVLCHGDGRDGSISGFVTLTEEDCANIYRLMVV